MSAIALEHGWLVWTCDHLDCTETVEFRRMIGRPDPYGWSEERGESGDLIPVHRCPAHRSGAWEAAA